ncbi:hypothetical protein [Deinococcus soli (ex Cha et al. 2016)]|uniref:Uncharacterized protein n=2 Tax=Deinococcus soli (ex Cha et al. 2016) TaxID=1309411 RepID=A0AAE3XGQ0_9DEIO|nr:hypothetical protein [Deinococcus soli (ex Cha et al. 2016)]MDR6219850.1 hypothetical protein [Deinococcus soli (ex Cha et al. 2016)]MDR6329892.1 hypothetical protein [Deinococcus soli (ex Cha et al. 2016)]MDR6752757.1 hypothetical protein [Deinococcus soli (ex Cha et al. 2016)]
MAITQHQQHLIVQAHAEGHLDPAIARIAGVSIATVKRYRTKRGLKTTCETALRGEQGEDLTFLEAQRRGLKAEWREGHNDKYDLYVNGERVDAKASMQGVDGSWRFRLPAQRRSFFGRYAYAKDYAQDCEVVALVALYPGGRDPDFYLLSSSSLPSDVRIRPGGVYDAFRNDWSLVEIPGPVHQA